jgi:hypothetical protein
MLKEKHFERWKEHNFVLCNLTYEMNTFDELIHAAI